MSKPETWLDTNAVDGFESLQFMAQTTTDPIVILRISTDLIHAWEQMQTEAVRQAREEGRTWAEIAEALRRTRQSVWREYADQLGEDGNGD